MGKGYDEAVPIFLKSIVFIIISTIIICNKKEIKKFIGTLSIVTSCLMILTLISDVSLFGVVYFLLEIFLGVHSFFYLKNFSNSDIQGDYSNEVTVKNKKVKYISLIPILITIILVILGFVFNQSLIGISWCSILILLVNIANIILCIILHHKKMDEHHLHELYQILSEGLLSEYDLKNMGLLYREKPVYILQNGRLDMELAEGVYHKNIEKLIKSYFEFVNSDPQNNQIEEYIKSQIMHFYFVYIHPYFDVNGRTSRTMSMWYLLKNEAYPFIIFNRGISFKGSKYDRVIKDTKESNDMTYFLLMMLETLKVELEKEHVMEMVASNTKYKLSGLDYQTILYFLTMNGNKTLRDFSVMYNRFNDKKSIKEIYNEMIKHLIELEIFIVTRYTKRNIEENIPNMELVLNEKKVEIDSPHLSRIK